METKFAILSFVSGICQKHKTRVMPKPLLLHPSIINDIDSYAVEYNSADRNQKSQIIDKLANKFQLKRGFITKRLNAASSILKEKVNISNEVLTKFPKHQFDYNGNHFQFQSEYILQNGHLKRIYRCSVCHAFLSVEFFGDNHYTVTENQHLHLKTSSIKTTTVKDSQKYKILHSTAQWSKTTKTVSKNEIMLHALNECHDVDIKITDSDVKQIIKETKQYIPKTPSELTLPEHSQYNQKEWVRFSTMGEYNLLLLMYKEAEIVAKRSNFLFIDGTFKITPKPFQQTLNFTVLDPVTNRYIPIAHIFMKGKTEEAYKAALSQINIYLNLRHFTLCMTDFETSLINAVSYFVGPQKVYGCLFHYRQALYKKFASIKNNQNSELLYMLFQIYSSLPFLDETQFMTINKFLHDNNQQFLEYERYYQTTWVKRYALIEKLSSPIQIYTNDGIEAYHSLLNKMLPCAHPSISIASDKLAELDEKILNLNKQDIANGFYHKRVLGIIQTVTEINLKLQDLYNYLKIEGPKLDPSHIVQKYGNANAQIGSNETIILNNYINDIYKIDDAILYQNDKDLISALNTDFSEDETFQAVS